MSALSAKSAPLATHPHKKRRLDVNGRLKPTATLYEASSQYRRWTFQPEKLKAIREVVNRRAVEACKKNFEAEEELRRKVPEGSTSSSIKTPETFPSASDEAQLVRHYITSLRNLLALGILTDASGGRPIPSVVETIAITYLKRFYIRTSCLEHHPRSVMPVCLFLAGKAANHVFDIDRFAGSIDKLNKEDISDIEYLVLQTLKFDLYVQRIGNALHGWYLRLQQDPDKDLGRIDAVYHKAKGFLAASQLSDLEFTETISTISLACMRLADQELVDRVILSTYPAEHAERTNLETSEQAGQADADRPNGDASSEEPPQTNGKHVEEAGQPIRNRSILLARLQHIQTVIRENTAPLDVSKIKTIDKAIRGAQDPGRNKKTLLYVFALANLLHRDSPNPQLPHRIIRYQKRIQEREIAAAERRAAKIAKAQHEMDPGEMLFGPLVGQEGLHKNEHHMGESGMGIPAESGGLVFGGEGLRDVGMTLDDSDSD
ncbi:hypothetical protein QFC22_000257 [Naganishia vaughanmartiniae]|uniref:Uncharacterized protein n=1 Tax=Naganishia vaughanmartiniae TaxID=1424756 RepID=A0ACC2XNT8_9TREE|nr:hypothetical protein QFC22_000257 [Naganishia vaughanmartiniae]